MIDRDLSRYDQIAHRFTREQAEGAAFLKSGIATHNAKFNGMIEEIERVAIKSKAPMLLMGPTGAGKSFLARRVTETGERVRFNKEARERFMRFATLSTSVWNGNFRELSAAVTRLAILSEAGRITDGLVDEEIKRLQRMWQHYGDHRGGTEVDLSDIMGAEAAAQLDLFDALQLQAVIQVCRQSNSLSDAGRTLYAISRAAKAKPNDADRLKKYLTKFGVSWEDVSR